MSGLIAGSPYLNEPARGLSVAALEDAARVLRPLADYATSQRPGAHGDVKVVIDYNLCRKAAKALALVEEALASERAHRVLNPAPGDTGAQPPGESKR